MAINWYPIPIVRFSVNWVHGWLHGQGQVDIWQGRFQLEYWARAVFSLPAEGR